MSQLNKGLTLSLKAGSISSDNTSSKLEKIVMRAFFLMALKS